MNGRAALYWVAGVVAMFAAILFALYGLLRLVGSAGSRVDGAVPLLVAVALATLALRAVSAARTRDSRAPLRTSRASRRALVVALLVVAGFAALLTWQSVSYSSECDRLRAALADARLGAEPVEVPGLGGDGGSLRACVVPSSSSPELCEHRSGRPLALRARIWRWLFWQSKTESRARDYVVVDDGELVRYVFRR